MLSCKPIMNKAQQIPTEVVSCPCEYQSHPLSFEESSVNFLKVIYMRHLTCHQRMQEIYSRHTFPLYRIYMILLRFLAVLSILLLYVGLVAFELNIRVFFYKLRFVHKNFLKSFKYTFVVMVK